MAEIRIRDDGPGVRPDELERIFECFYRSDESRTSPQNGSGIGLAVVRQIAEGLGGSCRAENKKGLEIVITLPLSGKGDNDEKDTHSGR